MENKEPWNQPQTENNVPPENKKIIAGVLALVLGSFGIHKFILGYQTEGLIMLFVSGLGIVFSCFFFPVFGTIAMGLISFVEGIIYLTKTDQDFYQTYQVEKRGWL
jgi:TM2 domain-containing membrane protein YozV